MIWLKEHRQLAGAGLIVAAFATVAITLHCRKPPQPKVEVKQVLEAKKDVAQVQQVQKAQVITRRRGPVVRERYDPQGHLVERLTLAPTTVVTRSDTTAATTSETHETQHVDTSVKVDPGPERRWWIGGTGAIDPLHPTARPEWSLEVDRTLLQLRAVDLGLYASVGQDSGAAWQARVGVRAGVGF